jgi:hypothetical protein
MRTDAAVTYYYAVKLPGACIVQFAGGGIRGGYAARKMSKFPNANDMLTRQPSAVPLRSVPCILLTR